MQVTRRLMVAQLILKHTAPSLLAACSAISWPASTAAIKMPTANFLKQGLCTLLSLLVIFSMVVEDFADMMGLKGASEGLGELVKHLVLLAPCLTALAAGRGHATLSSRLLLFAQRRPSTRRASKRHRKDYPGKATTKPGASNLRGCTSSSTFLASLAASSWWLLCKAVAVSARTTYLLAKSPLQLAAFVARAYCSALAYCMRKSWAACKVLVAGTARVCLVTPLKLMVFPLRTVTTTYAWMTQKHDAVPKDVYATSTTTTTSKPARITLQRFALVDDPVRCGTPSTAQALTADTWPRDNPMRAGAQPTHNLPNLPTVQLLLPAGWTDSKALPADSPFQVTLVREDQPGPAGVSPQSSCGSLKLQSLLCSTPPRVSVAGAASCSSSSSSSRRSSCSSSASVASLRSTDFSSSSSAAAAVATAAARSQPSPLNLSTPVDLDSSSACSSACSYYARSPAARSVIIFNAMVEFDCTAGSSSSGSSNSSSSSCCNSPKGNLAGFTVCDNASFLAFTPLVASPPAPPAAAAAAPAAAVTKVLTTVAQHLQQHNAATPVAAPRAATSPTAGSSSSSSANSSSSSSSSANSSSSSSSSGNSRVPARAAPRRAAVPQAHLKLKQRTTTTSSSSGSGKAATTTRKVAPTTTTTTTTAASSSSSRAAKSVKPAASSSSRAVKPAAKSVDVVTRLTQAWSAVIPKKPLTLATCKAIARKAGAAAGAAAAMAAAVSGGKAVRRWM